MKILQTWASLLRIQIMGTNNRVIPWVGNENNLLLPASENLEPGTHRIKWPWKVQVGPKWCGLLAPWRRLLEVRGLIVPLVISTWPTDIVVNTPIFIAEGTPIMSLWQISTSPLVPDIVMQPQTSAPVQAEVLTQDRNTACILPWRADLPILVPLKHLYYSP